MSRPFGLSHRRARFRGLVGLLAAVLAIGAMSVPAPASAGQAGALDLDYRPAAWPAR